MIVLIGESGSGKSTIEKELYKRGYKKIISYTTRQPRNGEVNGVDYHFVTKDEFTDMYNNDKFAESANYKGNSYGVAKEDCVDNSIAVVEINGLRQLKNCDGINVKSFYIRVPRAIRKYRMLDRGDSLDNVNSRLLTDDEHFKDIVNEVDYVIENVDLNDTVEQIIKLISNSSSFMMTYTGKKFNPIHTTEDMINLQDIAQSLSKSCRFNGHCNVYYTVAQHCVAVSKELELRGASVELQLMGLLHDASEAYLADIPSPIKQYLPDYMSMETNVMDAIYKKYGLDVDNFSEDEINLLKQIDYEMCLEEAVTFTSNHKEWVKERPDIRVELGYWNDINNCTFESIKEEYLDRFNELYWNIDVIRIS